MLNPEIILKFLVIVYFKHVENLGIIFLLLSALQAHNERICQRAEHTLR